jgi:aryl-alcohol dehydrogenase-like predicted oxidoreductase
MAKTLIDRRMFLGALSMGTAHLLFKHPLLGMSGRFTSVDPLQFVALGKSGNRSSFLTRQERDKSIAVLRHAYDRGLRMFDCADTYGTHGIMSEALKSMDRNKLVITSKMWTRPGGIPEDERPDADIMVDRFRKELGVDYIDVLQIHCMVDEDWTDAMKKQMEILDKLKSKGIIKSHGVSVHTLEAMNAALADPWVDVIHVRINPYGIAMDKPDPEEVVEVIHKLHASGKGVIGMKLVGNGEYTNEPEKIDHSIRFVLGLGSVDMVIVGFENEEQVDNYLDRTSAALKSL